MSEEDSGKCEKVSNFDKGQIVMARHLGVSVAKTAKLVGCSRFAVISTCRELPEEQKNTNRRTRLKDAKAKRRKPRPTATEAQESSGPEKNSEPPLTA